MIACDLVRVVVCLGFLAVGDETVWLASSCSPGIRRSFMEQDAGKHEHPSVIEATRESLRYARQDHRVLALLA